MKIIVVSGGFDPIHSGHLAYLSRAKELGEKLIVLLNSDKWLIKKKGKFFLPFYERSSILENLVMVDEVLDFSDDELGSAINGLKRVRKAYPDHEIIFCNGGDRDKTNIPELSVDGIDFVFGVGGENKANSSSSILKKWMNYYEVRQWGEFFNLHEDKNVKVKELIVNPKKELSFQRHFFRSEIWFISQGACIVKRSNNQKDYKKNIEIIELNRHDSIHINKEEWHQIINPHNLPCKIIEIQYGEKTEEEDIERLTIKPNEE